MASYAYMIVFFSIGSVLFSVLDSGQGGWETARATFYGAAQGGGTMEGACGYGDLKQQGYGLETTALSPALFDNAQTCGACYEIQCLEMVSSGFDRVKATNLCPADPSKPSEQGDWCNPPNKHFDLTQLMFHKIGVYEAGIIPVQYRSIPRVKQGGIKFEIMGNPNFILILVYNVEGVWDVQQVAIKGSNTGWLQMKRNWGQKWDNRMPLQGQSMSFQVTNSDGKMVQSDNMAPADWQFGKT